MIISAPMLTRALPGRPSANTPTPNGFAYTIPYSTKLLSGPGVSEYAIVAMPMPPSKVQMAQRHRALGGCPSGNNSTSKGIIATTMKEKSATSATGPRPGRGLEANRTP